MINYKNVIGRKLFIGLVGCGRISTKHFDAIKNFKDELDLKAVCDTDKSILKSYEGISDINLYTNISSMLSSEKLDIVVLCTPSGLHAKQAIQAAKQGVNVVTEKPMATKYLDGVAMINACDDANVRLFVVKQNRLNPTVQLLKRARDEDRFGKIKLAHVNVFWTRPQEYYNQGNGWRGTWEFDGGAFMNQASHYVDLLLWLLGPASKVQSMFSTSRKIEAEDTGVINLSWRDGSLGSICVTMLTYPKNLEGSITILGEKGSVRVGGVALNEIDTWDFLDNRDYDLDIKSANYNTQSVYGNGHELYYRNVIDVLRGKDIPISDGREGLRSLEFLTAAYIAARDQTCVGLPLEF